MRPLYTLFFSFKGGVGRTSALMNTALYLTRRKKRVLLVDLDLSAPGIDIFEMAPENDIWFRFPSYAPIKCHLSKDFGEPPDGKPAREALRERLRHQLTDRVTQETNVSRAPRGFLELAGRWNDTPQPDLSYPREIRDPEALQGDHRYLYLLPRHAPGDGDLLLMRAANHDDMDTYHASLETFDLQTQLGGLKGDRPPDFAIWFKDTIEKLELDYVLMDGRPGLDDISKYAMRWLADCIVLNFNLNPWNLHGAIEAYKYALECPMQKQNPNILLVATPVPSYAQSSKLYADQYTTIETQMPQARNCGLGSEGRPIEIPYADILTLRDVLISDIDLEDPAVKQYERLGDLVIAGRIDDVENRIRAAEASGAPDRVIRAYRRLMREYDREEALFYGYGLYLRKIGQESEAKEQLDKAMRIMDERRRANPNQPPPSYLRDTAIQLARTELAIVRKDLVTLEENELWLDPQRTSELRDYLAAMEQPLERARQLVGPGSDRDTGMSHLGTGPHTLPKGERAVFAETHEIVGESHFIGADCLRVRSLLEPHMAPTYLPDRVLQLSLARSSYEFATSARPRDPLLALQRGLVESALSAVTLQNHEQGLLHAMEYFREAIKLGYGGAETYVELGRNAFCLAVTRQNASASPFPKFLPHPPFVVDPLATRNFLADEVLSFSFDVERLAESRDHFSKALRLRSFDHFAFFYRGVVGIARGAAAIADQGATAHLAAGGIWEDALRDMRTATLYEPLYRPAFVYSGLLEFLLVAIRESDELSIPIDLFYRQAFYRLEHFIDQELERLVPQVIGKFMPKPFYFDPEEIDLILDAPFRFIRTLEDVVFVPSLVNLVASVGVLGDDRRTFSPDPSFLEMIRAHALRDLEKEP